MLIDLALSQISRDGIVTGECENTVKSTTRMKWYIKLNLKVNRRRMQRLFSTQQCWTFGLLVVTI